jgi:hypothetical protein
MEQNIVKPNLNITLDVKAINYQNGNVMQTSGKLKTVFGGKGQIQEETLSFSGSDCSKSQMEMNYNSSDIAGAEKETEVELTINGRVLAGEKEIDVVSATAGFTKSEVLDFAHKSEDYLKLKMENSCDAKCAASETFYNHKTIEI